jgi:hypothetical protein
LIDGETALARYLPPAGMKRRLFNLAAAVSLVMMLATVGLWVRSYWRTDSVERTDLSVRTRVFQNTAVVSQRGHISFRRFVATVGAGSLPLAEIHEWRWRVDSLYDWGDLTIPHWAFVVAATVLPVCWYVTRQRKIPRRACTHCGYDLRATPERCPECGTAVAPKPAEAA